MPATARLQPLYKPQAPRWITPDAARCTGADLWLKRQDRIHGFPV